MLEQARDLIDAGFAIHWLHPLSKRPIGTDWQSKPVASYDTLSASYKDGNNIGVRLGKWSDLGGVYLHIIDVDVRDPEMVGAAMSKLREMLPEYDYENSPAVISGSGGASRHFYLISDKPFPPRKFAHSPSFKMVWDGERGRDVKKWDWELHLIGTGGQAAIPPSIHPETNLPYTWLREFDLLDLEVGVMPMVPHEAMERLIGYEDQGEVDPERLKPLGLKQDELRQYISELPYEAWFEDRDGWYRTGMAIHHETGGSDAGFELWCEFSKKSEKFDMRDSKRVWKSFKSRTERPFRMASVVAVVKDERMEQDFEDYGEGSDDLGDFDDFGEEETGLFDDILGDPVPKKMSRSQMALAKDKVEGKLGKPAPSWVKRLNEKHAIARVSGKTVVLDFLTDGRVTYGHVNDLHNFYENDRRPKDDTTVPVSKAWLQHSRRRTYENGIVFAPNQEIEGAYNHWQGFSVDADPNGSCKHFLYHLKHIFCAGDEVHYQYTLKWMAHLIQRPEDKAGVAIVAKGKKGIGKDLPFEYLGRIFKNHYITVANQEQMTGKFNQHQEKCLLLHMQEGFWAGDKGAEGRLKYLITSSIQMIEPKGMNAFPITSVLRLYISSNERWVVPASEDERRYFVLNVSDKKRNDREYFGPLIAEMNGSGPAALLAHLLKVDLTDFEVRDVPDSEGLGEQKLEGLKNVDRWWFNVLQEGFIEGAQEQDNIGNNYWLQNKVRVDKIELRDNYARWMRTRRFDGEELGEVAFTKRLKHLLPVMQTVRPMVSGARSYAFGLPDLQTARTLFEETIGSVVEWPEDQPIGEWEDEDDLG